MKRIFFTLACVVVAAGVKAEIKNGRYDGTMKCGALLTNAAQGPWSQPVQIQVAGSTVSWSRSNGRYLESGSGSLQSGRVSLSLDGGWNPGVNNTGKWRTVAILSLEGSNLTGPATIFAVDGKQRFRDCTVAVSVGTTESAQLKPETGPAKPLISIQSASQAAAQIGALTKPTLPALLGPVVGQAPSSGAVTGQMFNTKAQFLEKTRKGQFLDLKKISSDEKVAFSKSIEAVLNNDYGINSWPTERAMVNGIQVNRPESACKAEFEGNVLRTFVSAVGANTAMLTDRPPEFKGTEQDLRTARTAADEDLQQLTNQRDGWCGGRGTTHPYVTALPKLLSEFNSATAQAVNERRSQLQAQYQRKEADEATRKRNADDAKLAESAKKAGAENAQREKDRALKVQREARESGAASRNQQQIKSLGLPSNFVGSTLYVNYMGQWSPLMASSQWLGLLLENKKIASLQAISVGGYPGVSIKRTGQPAGGIVFRMEGKEAYVFAMVVNGRLEQIQSPADHSQVALMLKSLTIEEAMN